MNSLQDIRERVRLEVEHAQQLWLRDQTRRTLWFRPSSPERDGGIMAAIKCPGEGWEVVLHDPIPMDRSASAYVEQLTARGILGRLPVLSLIAA